MEPGEALAARVPALQQGLASGRAPGARRRAWGRPLRLGLPSARPGQQTGSLRWGGAPVTSTGTAARVVGARSRAGFSCFTHCWSNDTWDRL